MIEYQQPSQKTLHILTISGSLRAQSSNTAVLRALAALAPAWVELSHYDQLASLPYFNPDLDQESDTPPATVQRLRQLIATADLVLISSPEYAHGVPGALKNALDWLVSSHEFPNKPVALINPSPYSHHAQASLRETLVTMSARLIEDPAFTFALPNKHLNTAAMLADQASQRLLAAALAAVLVHIELQRKLPQ
jgi:chromate reductase, NAD(P)H dehydrogenase (quinone)